MTANETYLLEAVDVSKYFPVKNFFGRTTQVVKAVDRVSFSIRRGETFGLVGESGCMSLLPGLLLLMEQIFPP